MPIARSLTPIDRFFQPFLSLKICSFADTNDYFRVAARRRRLCEFLPAKQSLPRWCAARASNFRC
jgi:hypothetical protein